MLRPLGVMLALMLLACPQEKKPLDKPVDIGACNIDSDCIAGIVCSCDGCVARNKSIHVAICPIACETSPCDGKQAACVKGQCEIVSRACAFDADCANSERCVKGTCETLPKQPLVQPSDIAACNLDSDCYTDDTCRCDRCVARNKTIHVERCPQACTTSPCTGKTVACVHGSCQVVN
jgi:hypothetical protein